MDGQGSARLVQMSEVRCVAARHRAQLSGARLFVGVCAFAVSLIAVWFSSSPSANALTPDFRPIADAPLPFTFTPNPSPRPIANVAFEDGKGQKRTLADFRGKLVLLNLWATWCSSCRAEMPTLERLQSRLGGTDFEVVALSIDRGGQAVVKRFYDEISVRRLAIYVDTIAEAGNKLGVIGLRTTLLIDREGREIGRVIGPAEWDRPEVIETIRRYLPPRKM